MPAAFAISRTTGLLLLVAVNARLATAQQPPRPAPRCDGRIIHEIQVTTLRPPFRGESAYWRRIARALGLHHATTDTAVVRRFLALETGGVCSEFRMRESVRLLREQPFLADARIQAIPDDAGGVRVAVETIDEIPAIASAGVAGRRLSNLEIGNENMFGDAWLLAIHGSDRPLEGKSGGFRMSDFQFLGRPYQLDVAVDGGERTNSWLVDASHAYLTDLQHIAWEAGLAHAGQEFIVIHRGDDVDDLGLAYRRLAADVGGVLKLGRLRTPILIGALVVVTRREPLGAVAIGDNGVRPDSALVGQFPKVTRARLTGIGAWRNLTYITVHGFDALTGPQDLPTGVQLFGQMGRGSHTFSGASDLFVQGDLLAGVGSPTTYGELHLITEARREIGQQQWDGVVSSGLLGTYWKLDQDNILRSWLDYAGGWRVQMPFQLGLSTENERLIGYHGSLFGARRAGGGIDARHLLPRITNRADVAVGAFVLGARLWAGDAPFGVGTPLLSSAGVSLMAAVPPGSQKLVRLDVGTALRSGMPHTGWEVRFFYGDVTRRIRAESGDILGAREQLVGPDVFRP